MKKSPTYYVETFGCQMNVADSERIAASYKNRGFRKAKSLASANHIIIVTCMIRRSAEDRVYGLVQNLVKKKAKNHKIIVTGCMTGMAIRDKSGKFLKKIKDRMSEIDEFLPIEEVGFDSAPLRSDKNHAMIPISNGCNNFCTYCVVPYTRGKEVSRLFEDIINECKEAVKNGYSEITLLGQNVNSYGSDLIKDNKRGYLLPNGKIVKPIFVKHLGRKRIPTLFPYLLEQVSKIKGIKRVNFISSNPWDFSDELIEIIAKNKNISQQIHLPVQAGDNKILKKMNRWYTKKEYLKLMKKIRKSIPGVSITTDIIVGFCGETEKQFMETVDLVKKVLFSKAYISMYSDRPMTLAHKSFVDDVPHQEKKRRWRILDNLINKNAVKTPRRCAKYSSEVEGYQKLLIICGPTASGKTAVAVKLAKRFKGELISADSRQVYKEMDVVSGKDIPKNSKLLILRSFSEIGKNQNSKLGIKEKNYDVGYRTIGKTPVWLVDIIYPNQAFSVAHFVKYSQVVIDDIQRREKLPIIVGGTGLYIKALINGIETIGIPPNLKLRENLDSKTTEKLQEILHKFNPQKYSNMNNSDKNNPRRLIRAIEIEAFKSQNPNYDTSPHYSKAEFDVLQIGLTAPREVLLERIKKRVDERIKLDAFGEVKQLIKKGYSPKLPSMSGDGYKELVQFYHHELAREETIEKWINSDLEHARKQTVWFKKDKRTKWIDITAKNWYQKLENMVGKWYNYTHERTN